MAALRLVGRIGAMHQDRTGGRVATLQRPLRTADDLDRADIQEILTADGDAAREVDVVHVDRDGFVARIPGRTPWCRED